MKILLTDIAIQKLQWNGKTTTYVDEKTPGFAVRVGKNRKTFVSVNGKERSAIKLGYYPEISLKTARQQHLLTKSRYAHKTRPRAFSDVLRAFLEDSEKRLKRDTVSQYRYYLTVCPLDLENLTRAHIKEQLSKFDDKPHSQNYAHATLRIFLNWCLKEEIIETHPLMRSGPPNKLRSRDRVLSDEELARIWRCTTDTTYGRIVRLLILTGQRRIEVRNLKPEDVTDVLTFHTKGDRINILPITPLIRENLVLPFKFNNWGTAKAKFDTDCQVDWVHHDARRTLATRLASLGVNFFTIERILGHALGKVASVYQRYSYLKEMEEALLLWEAHIRKITAPEG